METKPLLTMIVTHDADNQDDLALRNAPRSRPCSLEEQYFKCGIFCDYDAPQRRVSNSEAPFLARVYREYLFSSEALNFRAPLS